MSSVAVVQPGDTVLFTVGQDIPSDAAAVLHESIAACFPGARVYLVAGDGMPAAVTVYRPTDMRKQEPEHPAAGRCGDRAPSLDGADLPPVYCALPSGHGGWHRADNGAEWSLPPETWCRNS